MVSREPTSVIMVHVKVARCHEQSAYLCYHGSKFATYSNCRKQICNKTELCSLTSYALG